MTYQELEGLLEQAATLGDIKTVYFEGGEPMLYYPLLLRGIELATSLGLKARIVTCGYFATNPRDGEAWLRPLKAAGLRGVEVSIDAIHGTGEAYTHGMNLVEAATDLGMSVAVLSVCDPRQEEEQACLNLPDEPSDVMYKGRAAHELVEGLELHPWEEFDECDVEFLESPKRVHVDPYGNVHICQGILAGNVWESSLAQITRGYSPHEHPIIGPLIKGGPAALVREHWPDCDRGFASQCHACYEVRRVMRKRFRLYLGPAQVYGEEPDPPPDSYH
jgi:hypothetical protein